MQEVDNLKVKHSYKPAEYYGEDGTTSGRTLSVLLIGDDKVCHALYIPDPEKLTGCKIRPKCYDFSSGVLVKQYNYKYNSHLKNCD
jgi:hypothetical protein